MSLSTRTKIDLGFASALLILTTVGMITYGSTADFVRDARDVAQTHQALESLERVLSHLKDVQSSERGFVITGREQYLDPYHAALPLLDAGIGEIRSLLADRPLQQERLERVDSLVARRVARAERVAAIRRNDGFDAAAEIVREGTGKQLVDEVRLLVRQMINEETALLSAHRAAAETSGQRTQLAIVLGSLLGFLMVGIATVVIRRDFAERTRGQGCAGTGLPSRWRFREAQYPTVTAQFALQRCVTSRSGNVPRQHCSKASSAISSWWRMPATSSTVRTSAGNSPT